MGANGSHQAFPYAAQGVQAAQRTNAPRGTLWQRKAARRRGVSGA